MLSAGAVSAAASECQRLTSNEKVVVCEVVPLLPVIVIVRVPVLAFLETVMVKVEVPEPGAVIEAGDMLVAIGTPVALERLEGWFQPVPVPSS